MPTPSSANPQRPFDALEPAEALEPARRVRASPGPRLHDTRAAREARCLTVREDAQAVKVRAALTRPGQQRAQAGVDKRAGSHRFHEGGAD